jgi:hypothetical protein
MEVHQHTHTPRKNGHIISGNFSCCFLAVFCGILAENFREHIIDHGRELQYMKSMLADLDEDIILLQSQKMN